MRTISLIIPIGLPGSGKSTWCRMMFPDHVYVSSDDIRQSITGDTYDASRNPEVWDVYYHDIHSSLFKNQSVVADATNLTRRNRMQTLECMPAHSDMTGWEVHAIVFRNVAQAITRNRAREPGPGKQGSMRVPDDQMMSFVRLYEQSLQDILSEGYDTITYIEEWG